MCLGGCGAHVSPGIVLYSGSLCTWHEDCALQQEDKGIFYPPCGELGRDFLLQGPPNLMPQGPASPE